MHNEGAVSHSPLFLRSSLDMLQQGHHYFQGGSISCIMKRQPATLILFLCCFWYMFQVYVDHLKWHTIHPYHEVETSQAVFIGVECICLQVLGVLLVVIEPLDYPLGSNHHRLRVFISPAKSKQAWSKIITSQIIAKVIQPALNNESNHSKGHTARARLSAPLFCYR